MAAAFCTPRNGHATPPVDTLMCARNLLAREGGIVLQIPSLPWTSMASAGYGWMRLGTRRSSRFKASIGRLPRQDLGSFTSSVTATRFSLGAVSSTGKGSPCTIPGRPRGGSDSPCSANLKCRIGLSRPSDSMPKCAGTRVPSCSAQPHPDNSAVSGRVLLQDTRDQFGNPFG